MGNVISYMSMSLDGFVAGPNDEVDELHTWSMGGDTEYKVPGSENEVMKVAPATAKFLRETWPAFGAVIVGRRTFDLSNGWGGKPPLGLPHFVVTHRVPPEWTTPGSSFTFVTEGVASAVKRATEAAGDEKNVSVSGASIIQQFLNARLLDEIHAIWCQFCWGRACACSTVSMRRGPWACKSRASSKAAVSSISAFEC